MTNIESNVKINANVIEYSVIGMMSGTSMDGLDMAACTFKYKDSKWDYKILHAGTYPYRKVMLDTLRKVNTFNQEELQQAHIEYGNYLGKRINDFRAIHKLNPDFVSSHGHTVFHQPEKHFTFQLGNGAAIASMSGLDVVCDFRYLDVQLGGQGAPLVPIGDKLLFQNYEYCLNIGGIANISYEKKEARYAYDICIANIALNFLSSFVKRNYDDEGKMAANGKVDERLLNMLNSFPYFNQHPPKSLGREWFDENMNQLLQASMSSIEDKLATVCEHIAIQIGNAIKKSDVDKINNQPKLLITGGGAHNIYLINRIKAHTEVEIIIPDKMTVDFKEALIFAFLGVLKVRGDINCLSSVTGASEDSSAGIIFIADTKYKTQTFRQYR